MKKIIIILLLCFVNKAEAQTSAYNKADSLLQIGRYQTALQLLDNIKPANFLSNLKKATIYDLIDNENKAIVYYEKALAFKDDYQTKLKLAKAYQKIKKDAKAISIYEAVSQIDPENLLVQYQLGKLYLKNNQKK